MQRKFTTTAKAVALSLLAVGANVAFAQATGGTDSFDPSSYVTKITGAIAGLLSVGGAVFGLNVAIKSTKWARKAL